jgi:hypothetical protein
MEYQFGKFTNLINTNQIIMLDNNLKLINKSTKYPFKLNDGEVLVSLNDKIYLIYNKKTSYIECIFDESLKYIQSGYYLNNLELSDGYVKYIMNKIKNPKNCLVLGLCIGNIPNELSILNKSIKKIDCVEINPLLCKVYNEYFKISSKINIYEESANDFVNKTINKYDSIIVDIPREFITAKFMKKVKSILDFNGSVYVNIYGANHKNINKKSFEGFSNINYERVSNNNIYMLN